MPEAFAAISRSRWQSSPLAVWNGLMAPRLSESEGSWMALWRSIPMTFPKPRQSSHAPMGELNEKWAAVGLARVKPVSGLVQLVENFLSLVSQTIVTLPLPLVRAASMASWRRVLFLLESLTRSWMT